MEVMSQDVGELAKALAQAQAELEPATKSAQNPHLKNRYADIAAVYTAIRSVLPKYELAVVQTSMPCEVGFVCIRTTLMHSSGQWIAGEITMPADRMGGVQGLGSAMTYARRYSLSAIVGVVSEDDDDGHKAQQANKKQTQQQAKQNNANPPSEQLRKAFNARLNEYYANTPRDEQHRLIGEWLGRTIATFNELTAQEMSEFLEATKGQ